MIAGEVDVIELKRVPRSLCQDYYLGRGGEKKKGKRPS